MTILKFILTLPVVGLLTQPLWAPHWGAGILGEVTALGFPSGLIALAVFFGLVALYCRSLHKLALSITPAARTMRPESVWLMFAIPFNFVEDFFIVTTLASSLREDARIAGTVRMRWTAVGIFWCSLQILSLLPGVVGVGSGLFALVAWVIHWGMTSCLTRQLHSMTLRDSFDIASSVD